MGDIREGELPLENDPASYAADARLVFIGRVRSPWRDRSDCPKNMAAAREAGLPASVEVFAPFREGLSGLGGYSHVVILSWFDRAARNLIVQKPRHATDAKGVFALRSPVRPNPVGLHIAGLREIDEKAGILVLDGIDLLDGTPVVDIKPYFASVDAFPHAARPQKAD